MPYSKAWRSAMYPDYKEEKAYVDYKATKAILRRMKENMANPATPDELYASLLSQKEMVYQWCTRKVKELELVAEALFKASENLAVEEEGTQASLAIAIHTVAHDTPAPATPDGAPAKTHSPPPRPLRPKDAKLIADSVMHELLRYVECKNLNTDTIEHILGRMYRYAVLGPTGERWKKVYTEWDYNAISIDLIFYFLSSTYDRVKQCEDRLDVSEKNNGAVGSQTFDRRSVKYWVHLQDLPFVIARIVPHLPLSTFTDTYAESKRLQIPFTLFSPVSSVYWDNPQFLFYHRRLERVEGSTLIRMRWYSDTFNEDWNALKDTDRVFMEIKVHHEAWSGERSNKRRFALKANEVDSFVGANLSLNPALDKLKKDGASAKQQDNFQSLATEILSKIHAYQLKPAMRTQCGRAAFQRGADQSVRVSIDTNLRFSAEDFGLGHHWRYEGNDAPHHTFPYAVVEVKLQCAENQRIAPWIEELMSCRYMESIPKFSKYAHGIATLYGHTRFIHMVPYWMHQLDIDIRASTKPELSQWDPTVGLSSGCLERAADRFIFGTGAAQTQSVGASEAKFLPRGNYTRVYQSVLRQLQQRHQPSASPAAEDDEGLLRTSTTVDENLSFSPQQNSGNVTPSNNPPPAGKEAAPVVQYSVDHRHHAYTTFHLYPYVESGVESVCFSTPEGKNDTAQVAFGAIPWQIGKRIRVPQKYDPKTLLTAERYMAEWAHFASQIGLLGIGIISFGRSLQLPKSIVAWSPLWSADFHIVLGLSLVLASLFTLAYSYVAFRARCRRVYARRKIRFDHPAGPTWLTCAIMFCLFVLGCSHIASRYGPMITRSDDF